MTSFKEGIEDLITRRRAAAKQIANALAHFNHEQIIYLVTSYIDLDVLEAMVPTICSGDHEIDAAIIADFMAAIAPEKKVENTQPRPVNRTVRRTADRKQ